jgi:hypothetical protein
MAYKNLRTKRRHDREEKKKRRLEQQDISGLLGGVANPPRRGRAVRGLRPFCETYLTARFSRPWSPDHLIVMDDMEQCVHSGGIFPVAMPRGSGKTALCLALSLWAVLSGLRKFVLLIGATKDAATELLDSLKAEND